MLFVLLAIYAKVNAKMHLFQGKCARSNAITHQAPLFEQNHI
jgi:hypothetical protein